MPVTAAPHSSTAASRALLVAAVAGIVLVPEMFTTWYQRAPQAGLGTPSGTAWQVFSKLDVILFLTAVLGAGSALILGSLGRRRGVPGWGLLGGALVGSIGTVGGLMLLYRIIDVPSSNPSLLHVRPGAYAGLALTAALAAAGWTAALVGLRAVRRGYAVVLAPVVPVSRQLPPASGLPPAGPPPGRGPLLPGSRR